MDKYENIATHNIAETCCDPLSLSELSELSLKANKPENSFGNLFNKKLDYGHIRGSPEFRKNVSLLYSSPTLGAFPDRNVLITPGGIAANFLLFYTLVGPGDHVICMYPTYQQLYAVPESFGAEVELWKLKEDEGFSPDIEALKKMIRLPKEDGTGGTKMIIIKYSPPLPRSIDLTHIYNTH